MSQNPNVSGLVRFGFPCSLLCLGLQCVAYYVNVNFKPPELNPDVYTVYYMLILLNVNSRTGSELIRVVHLM